MNWQLVRNVPPFRDRIIMLYEKRSGTLFFGRLVADLDEQLMLELSTGIIDGGIGFNPETYDYEEVMRRSQSWRWAEFVEP